MERFLTETPEGREIAAEIEASLTEGRRCVFMPHLGASWAGVFSVRAMALAGTKHTPRYRAAWDAFRRSL